MPRYRVIKRYALFPRKCERCGFEYATRQAVYGGTHPMGGSSGAAQAAWERRRKQLLKSRRFLETTGVLCPKCGRFSEASIARHFPDGFRDGLLRRARPKLNFLMYLRLMPVVVLSVAALCVPDLRPAVRGLIVIALVAAGGLYAGLELHRRKRILAEVRKHLDTMPDGDVERFVAWAYKRSEENLALPPIFSTAKIPQAALLLELEAFRRQAR